MTTVRAGGTVLEIFNSGNEVWLYDGANRDVIRTARGEDDEGAGGMPPDFDAKTAEGLVVGYGLLQDDELHVSVWVGEPFTDKELSVGRWLEPQVAYLKLPSGTLCVEPNDGSRIGPEEPTDKGAVVAVPKGDYKLTLYRVDHEALDRDGIAWKGPQELIVLTPGGTASDAASALLPFEPRRDRSWVGKYTIDGRKAEALVWFGDYWDTFVLNLDSAAVAQLSLQAGSYLRTRVPTTGLTLVSAFAASWQEAKRLPRPAIPVDEYGFAALSPMGEWNGAEGMFCRRDATKTAVDEKYLNSWIACTVEVLDTKPRAVRVTQREFTEADLAEKTYFDFDSGFLSLILSDVLPGVGDLDELSLPDALERFDAAYAELGLKPAADVSWEEAAGDGKAELTARLYTGRDDCFAAVIGQEGNIHVAVLTEGNDGEWLLTGLLDDFERAVRHAESRRSQGPTITINSMDEALSAIVESHAEVVEGADVKKAPSTRDDVEGALRRFLTAAFS